MLRALWRRFVLLILPRLYKQASDSDRPVTNPYVQPEAPPPWALPPPPPEPPMDKTAPVSGEVSSIGLDTAPRPNRHTRRGLEKWERERRKHDVLVTPAVPAEIPPRKPHVKHEGPKPRPQPAPEPDDIDNTILMRGENGLIYHEQEMYGEFRFRDTILEQLDLYWVYLRRMKMRDPGAYELYRRVGATIVPPVTFFLHNGIQQCEDPDRTSNKVFELTPWWKQNRPGFGCVTYGQTKKIEQHESEPIPGKPSAHWWVPKFLHFTKYKRPPPGVAPMSGGDIYMLTIWWDRPFKPQYNYKKSGMAEDYAVFLDDRHVRVLPMLDTKYVDIPRKKNGLRHFSIPQRAWHIPDRYTKWAQDRGETPEHLLAGMFMDTARAYETSNYGMIRVAVRNKDLVAQFSIDPTRMSYFFQDRDVVYTPNGAREHCFHIVRAHERHTAKGVSPVRLHFRGAKKFTWAGYEVEVSVPLRDHLQLAEYDIGAIDDHWVARQEQKKYIKPDQIGEILADAIKQGKVLRKEE
jgi:hypothetical protein